MYDGHYACDGVDEWRPLATDCTVEHRLSLAERGLALCAASAPAKGSDVWRRIVYGATDAEVAAVAALRLSWEENEAYIRKETLLLAPVFHATTPRNQAKLLSIANYASATALLSTVSAAQWAAIQEAERVLKAEEDAEEEEDAAADADYKEWLSSRSY